MSDGVKNAIKFSSPARRCPFCHDKIESVQDKCVCNSCLAISHVDCWNETGACPSCRGTDRLIQERPYGSPTADIAVLSEPRYELEPPRTRSSNSPNRAAMAFQELRRSPHFERMLSGEGRAALQQALFKRFWQRDFQMNDPAILCFVAAFLMALLTIPALGAASLLLVLAIGAALAVFLARHRSRLQERIAHMELIPFPVRIVEVSRQTRDGLHTCLLELDATSAEEPALFYPVHEDKNQRIVGLDIEPELARRVKTGDMAVLVTEEHRVLLLEPVTLDLSAQK